MTASESELKRLRYELGGVVQGVGLRPFLARLAAELQLSGYVCNSARGVELEIQGPAQDIERFRQRLRRESPAACKMLETTGLDVPLRQDDARFRILASSTSGQPRLVVSPDLALCQSCRREMLDPSNRRFRYPFISCTQCGPRYSITHAVPFDRQRTSLKAFPLCDACQAEYDDPQDLRFHAQTIACHACGPQVALWDDSGSVLAARDEAIAQALMYLQRGEILAVRGIGGFHLLVDAADALAVARLRLRKGREAKPLAVMFPTLDSLRTVCKVSHLEQQLLTSPPAPIVLLQQRRDAACKIACNVAPDNPLLGCFLPYTPLHELLVAEMGRPLVATSGNRSEEVICTDNAEALSRLHGVADAFLVHDRPIVQHVDDSVVRVVLDRELVLRSARGYAPARIRLRSQSPALLAVGAQQKNTIAFAQGAEACLSPHLGDLGSAETTAVFRRTANEWPSAFGIAPVAIACDQHPDYLSKQFAEQTGRPLVRVQHHHAHILSCCADNEIAGPVLGVAWDGAGWGPDGTIWGGEFLLADSRGFERVAQLRSFRLPGGTQAAREPKRSALGLLYAAFGPAAIDQLQSTPLATGFSPAELAILTRMLEQNTNSPETTSVGRLFDGVAALLGLRAKNQFEGQAAMDLEFAAEQSSPADKYDLPLRPDRILDWQPLVEGVRVDLRNHLPVSRIAAKFHHALVAGIVAVATRVGQRRVILTGGCFQNAYLLTQSVNALRQAGFEPYWHRRVPPNDGGIALGQLVAAAATLSPEK